MTGHKIGWRWVFVAPALAGALACSKGGSKAGDGADAGPKPDLSLTLSLVSGDGQTAVAGTELLLPLVVKVTNRSGSPVQGSSILWSAENGGGFVSASSSDARMDGTASIRATLGGGRGESTFRATLAANTAMSVVLRGTGVGGLAYVDPPAGAKIRLVRVEASTSTGAIALALVAGTELTGYSVGFSLPIETARVRLFAAGGFEPGSALSPGESPAAAKGVIATRGRLHGMLVTGLSQKAAGGGAVPSDTRVQAGAVFYTIRLEAIPGASPGVVFDGSQPGPRFRAGMRDFAGSEIVAASEVAIGRLEVR